MPLYSIWVGACFLGSFGYSYAKNHFGLDAVKSINVFLGSIALGGVLGYYLTKLGIEIWPTSNGIKIWLPSKHKSKPPESSP